MTDPMQALNGLQTALDAGAVRLQPCDVHRDLMVLLDHPTGTPRFTYALMAGRLVQAIALFALVQPHEGLQCFQLGIAVIEKMRGQGIGSRVLQQSIGELRNGLSRTPMKEFYIEAVVSIDNHPSNAIAKRLISDSPTNITDAFSKEPALQYLRKLKSGI